MTDTYGLALRRCALAVSVLHDIDLQPALGGVVLTAEPKLRIGWAECRRALAGAEPESERGRQLLAQWFRLRSWIAARGPQLAELARPYGVAVDNEAHPGLDWVRHRVLGDALDVGLGFIGLDPAHPDRVVVPPHELLRATRLPAGQWWTGAARYLERMGEMARQRYRRDPRAPIRPMGDCDVVTLLASRTLRAALASAHGGMRAAAVPIRSRGWLDLSRIDPAFVLAAAALTEPAYRGFSRPLLVTADEVTMPLPGGRPEEIVLRDPAINSPVLRRVLYR